MPGFVSLSLLSEDRTRPGSCSLRACEKTAIALECTWSRRTGDTLEGPSCHALVSRDAVGAPKTSTYPSSRSKRPLNSTRSDTETFRQERR